MLMISLVPCPGNIQIGSNNVLLLDAQSSPAALPTTVSYKVTTGTPLRTATQLCRGAGCDKYGDPALSGYCSSCYHKRLRKSSHSILREKSSSLEPHVTFPEPPPPPPQQSKSHSAPIHGEDEAPTTEEQYTRAMHRLEDSVRSSVRQCKAPTCTNFGNPKSHGYCNDCYQASALSAPGLPSTHGRMRIYRNGGYDECDLGRHSNTPK